MFKTTSSGCLIVIDAFFVSKFSYENSQVDAKLYVKELAGKYATQIQGEVNLSVSIVQTLASNYEEAIEHNIKLDKKETLSTLVSILKKNDQLLGIWWGFNQKNILFEAKDNNANEPKNWYSKDGHFAPYTTRSKGKIILEQTSSYDNNCYTSI